jgi:ribosomal protein L1
MFKIFHQTKLIFQNRYLDKVFGLTTIPYPFDQQIKRTVLMFSKKSEDVNPGQAAGAAMVGGTELVKAIQTGDVAIRNVDYIVATNEILPDLAPIRGLFKKQYPNSRHGNSSSSFGF